MISAKLPNLNPAHYKWDGDCSTLGSFLEKFARSFQHHDNTSALDFLYRCIPQDWHVLIKFSQTLKQALNTISLVQ